MSSQATFNLAFKELILCATAARRLRGHTLDTATDEDTSFAHFISSSYFERTSVIFVSFTLFLPSQSFPPTTSTIWCCLWVVESFATASLISEMCPLDMQTHYVFNSIFSSTSQMMLLPMSREFWVACDMAACQCNALTFWVIDPILTFKSATVFIGVFIMFMTSVIPVWNPMYSSCILTHSICTHVAQYEHRIMSLTR